MFENKQIQNQQTHRFPSVPSRFIVLLVRKNKFINNSVWMGITGLIYDRVELS